MRRNGPITPEKEQEILAALEQDSHASRVARTLGDVSYATVWRIADRNAIELEAGREAKGYKRHPPELWAKVEQEVAANPDATQQELARKIGVSRSTVGRVVRSRTGSVRRQGRPPRSIDR
jgi:transposase-like protein